MVAQEAGSSFTATVEHVQFPVHLKWKSDSWSSWKRWPRPVSPLDIYFAERAWSMLVMFLRGLNGYVASHLLTECIVFNWLWSQQKRQPHLIYWTVKGRLLQILGKQQLVLDSSKYNDVLTKGTFIKEDLIAYLTLGTGCLNGKWKYAKRFLFFRGRSKGNRRIKLRIEKPFLLPPFHYG